MSHQYPVTMKIHIHSPRGFFIGQIRMSGFRKWETVTGKCKCSNSAMAKAVMKMSSSHNRARVLFCTDWYDPNIVMECNR